MQGKSGTRPRGLRDEQDLFFQAWVTRIMDHSDKVGIDYNSFAWLDGRALVRINNMAAWDDKVHATWQLIRRWTYSEKR
jgi:hypothetical protein